MKTNCLLLFLLFISMIPACSRLKNTKRTEELYREYREICRDNDQKIVGGRKRLREMVKPWERMAQKKMISEMSENKQRAWDAFLTKLENISPPSRQIRLLQARILMESGKLEEAEKQLGQFSGSAQAGEGVRMEKLRLYILSKKTSQALALFQEIESTMKDPVFYTSCLLYFSFYAPDPVLRKKYSERFLNLPSIRSERLNLEASTLACLRLSLQEDVGNREGQSQSGFIQRADPRLSLIDRLRIRSEEGRYSLIGRPIRFSLDDNWIEFPPMLRQNRLSGKLTIITWAHWLPASKDLLAKFQREKPSDTLLIGMTKLYGFIDPDSRAPVSPQEEVNYIHQQAGFSGSELPLLISSEGNWLQGAGISLLPAVVVADERMNVEWIEFGRNNGLRMLDRIVNIKRGE